MGISRELDDLIATVKFENAHMLTRPELYRFGIDTRTMAETAWTLQTASRPYVRKIVLERKNDGASFRTMEWRLFCENKARTPLMFLREFDKDAVGTNSVAMVVGPDKPVSFGVFPARTGTFEAWSGTIAPDTMKAVLAASHLQMAEATLGPDGKSSQELFDIDTVGLEPAWTELVEKCPAAPNPAPPADTRAAGCAFQFPIRSGAVSASSGPPRGLSGHDSRGSTQPDKYRRRMLSFMVNLHYMHLHEKSARRRPRASPLRSHRPDARKHRHRLFGAGAGGHAGRIVERA